MKAEVLIDWITFTVKGRELCDVISSFLGLDPDLFVSTGFSLNGYTHVVRFSDIFVMDQPRENDFFKSMGVCVSMSGNGCRAFEKFTSFTGVPFLHLFREIVNCNANVTRLDVACDDRHGALNMDTIIEKTRSGDICSRMTNRSIVSSWDGVSSSGSTVYIGSESSAFRLRLYDKAAEQGIAGHWVRLEMVLRQKYSLDFVEHAALGVPVGKLAAQVLNDKFRFIDRDDSNITRCSSCSWWVDFVQEVDSLHLSKRTDVAHPVDHIDEWIRFQVAPSLAILLDTLGFAHLYEMILASRDRLTDQQKALIDDFKRMIGRSSDE